MIFVVKAVFSQDNKLQSTTLNTLKLPVNFTGLINIRPYFKKNLISENFYTKNLGFFCRQEIKFESATKIPFKFRLGSVQYCDWIEGKIGAANPILQR